MRASKKPERSQKRLWAIWCTCGSNVVAALLNYENHFAYLSLDFEFWCIWMHFAVEFSYNVTIYVVVGVSNTVSASVFFGYNVHWSNSGGAASMCVMESHARVSFSQNSFGESKRAVLAAPASLPGRRKNSWHVLKLWRHLQSFKTPCNTFLQRCCPLLPVHLLHQGLVGSCLGYGIGTCIRSETHGLHPQLVRTHQNICRTSKLLHVPVFAIYFAARQILYNFWWLWRWLPPATRLIMWCLDNPLCDFRDSDAVNRFLPELSGKVRWVCEFHDTYCPCSSWGQLNIFRAHVVISVVLPPLRKVRVVSVSYKQRKCCWLKNQMHRAWQ